MAGRPAALSAENPFAREGRPWTDATVKAVLAATAYNHREGDFVFSMFCARRAVARAVLRALARVLPGVKVPVPSPAQQVWSGLRSARAGSVTG